MKHITTFEDFLNENNINETTLIIKVQDDTELKKFIDSADKLKKGWQLKVSKSTKPKHAWLSAEAPFAVELTGSVNDLSDFINAGPMMGEPIWSDSSKLSDNF